MAITIELRGASDHDITAEVYSVEISRGRSRELDEIEAGTCTIRTRNQSGNFNPYFAAEDTHLLLEDGLSFLLLEDGASRIQLESGGAGIGDYGSLRPGMGLAVMDGAVTVFSGIVEDFDYTWEPSGFADVSILAVDGLGQLGRQHFLEWTTTDNQGSGARVSAVLARSEVDTSWATSTSIDTGSSTFQDDLVTHGSNVLNYLQLCAKSEQGRLFVTRDNILKFVGRDSLTSGSTAATFGDSGANFRFSDIKVTYGSELLYTKVSCDREGGTKQTATDTTAVANYGIRHLVLGGLLLSSDAQASDMAFWLLGRYKDPEATVSELTVILDLLSTADRATIAAIDIGNVVALTWTPTADLGSVTQTLTVEGVGYSRTVGGKTTMTFQLSEAQNSDSFTLDSDELGILDQNILGF